jgi:poly-beta-1,6-N-acetyl-D-glucosamine synthase
MRRLSDHVERPMTSAPRVLLLTTAHNEARFVEALVRGVTCQTERPERWLIVDDGSTDGTYEAFAARVGGLEWVTLLRRDPRVEEVRDRLATAAVPRALNWALATLDLPGYTHIGKVDADVELPPDFFEQLLRDFADDRALGITGGVLTEKHGGGWRQIGQPPTHAPPPARVYSAACFAACGGFRDRLGWDTIDEVYARMRGFTTRVSSAVPVRHMRVQGVADGRLRGRARHGACAWITHYPAFFVLLRSLKVAVRFTPVGIAGLAFLWGYFGAALTSAPQVEDMEFRRFVRRELRARVIASVWPGRPDA